MFNAFESVCLALKFDPALARRCLYTELLVQCLQVPWIIVVQLLSQARVLEMTCLGSHPVRLLGQGCSQLGRQLLKSLRYNRRIGDDWHEICVAIPPGHDVDVKMLEDACPCDSANVDANIEALCVHDLSQRVLAPAG